MLAECRAADAARTEVAILDHGCGSAFTLLYLLALGFERIYGVDVKKDPELWNRLLREVYGVREQRFWVYDGCRLPLPDCSMDLIFSEQVLEHVNEDLLDSYYAEERRVLKEGGWAYHEVPHRLVPFDSHTRTWFVHYLPRKASLRLHRIFGSNIQFLEKRLFLRWPSEHRGKLAAHFDDWIDLTPERLRRLQKFDYYDGPVRLRRFFAWLVRLPGIGMSLARIVSNFVMMDTVAIKQVSAGASKFDFGHRFRQFTNSTKASP